MSGVRQKRAEQVLGYHRQGMKASGRDTMRLVAHENKGRLSDSEASVRSRTRKDKGPAGVEDKVRCTRIAMQRYQIG